MPPMMSNWDADKPDVTPAWWKARKMFFPNHLEPEFTRFYKALKLYTTVMTPDHMDQVISALDVLDDRLAGGKELTLISKHPTVGKILKKLTLLNSATDRTSVSVISVESGRQLHKALQNMRTALLPAANAAPVPARYQV